MQNVGNLDKILRIFLALGLGWIILFGFLRGVGLFVGLIIAVILLATSSISYCPLYKVFSINTKKNTKNN